MIAISSADASLLEGDACRQIQISHDLAWQSIRRRIRRPQWEPHFVAHLCASMVGVSHAWRARLEVSHPGIQLTASVVFTHQSPYVTWGSPRTKRCELADLLIAFIDRTSGRPHGMAILIQAKQSDTGTVRPSTPSEQKQFELLSTRPAFDVDAPNAPRCVDLKKYMPDNALLYGLTPPSTGPPILSWRSPHRWHTADNLTTIPGNTVIGSRCLAETLVEVLVGRRGWGFDLPPGLAGWRHFNTGPARDEWAMLINYLLERSFKNPVNALRAAGRSGQRREEHALWLKATTPKGSEMFYAQSVPDDVQVAAPFSWIAEGDAQTSGWTQAGRNWMMDQARNGGGDGSDVEREEPGEEDPENGPISVVLLTLDRKE